MLNLLPRQVPPVMRTLQGDYVLRAGQVVFVRWAYLTKMEQGALWQRVNGAPARSCGAGFC